MDLHTLLLLCVCLLLAAIVLLAVLLFRQGRIRRDLADGMDRQGDQLTRLGHSLLDGLDAQRDDTVESLNSANSQILNTLSSVGQSQNSLLESVQRQVLLSTRNQAEQFTQLSGAVSDHLGRLEARMDAMRQENSQQLEQMRHTVDDKLTESIDKRLTNSFARVTEQLEKVYQGLGEMQNLAVGVGDLKKVLTNVKTRGIWGEMQLGSLLAELLSPGQYETNVAVVPGSSERVEFAVKLPGKDAAVWLPIDSKFPQESYLRLLDATQNGDAAGADAARKALAAAIRNEGRRISGKYVKPPYTTDFALMFLPVEGLYAEAVQQPDLTEALQRECRVVVAGPSTLAALLNALQMGFRTLAIEQRSGEVWRLLSAVKAEFGRFADTLEKTQQRLQQASESIDSAYARTRSIQKQLGNVEIPLMDAGDDTP